MSKHRLVLDMFNKECPFNSEQLKLHVQTINLRYKLGNVNACLRNNEFIESLWKTLVSWGMGARGAKLLPLKEFKKVLLENEGHISKFEGIKIDDKKLATDFASENIWELINNIRVSEAANPIVSGTKTLHHILPELIPPIDREYTRPFFGIWMQHFQNSPKTVFHCIWRNFCLIARKIDLRLYVGRISWNTSITKVIDNAIIGFCKYRNIPKLR